MEGSGSSGTYPLWFEELLLFMLFADEGLEGEYTFKWSGSKALQTYLLASKQMMPEMISVNKDSKRHWIADIWSCQKYIVGLSSS